MGIQTFEFPARVNAAGDMRFRVRKAQFGDGYAQVSGDGINPIVRSWELTFVGKYDYITPIIVFLENLSNGRHRRRFPACTAARVISRSRWAGTTIH